jgi:indolepyruvate ferredoxin oxidoreductase alpha subunit
MRKELTQRYRQAETLLASAEFFPRCGSGRRGIVASGVGYAYASQIVEDLGLHREVTLQQIGAYPIPEALMAEFLQKVDSVLVVEELTPYVEEWLSFCAHRHLRQIPILGKHSEHLPAEYEYTPDLVEQAIREYLQLDQRTPAVLQVPDLPPRPPVLCPGCSHRSSFYLARKVFGKKTVYCNDIGCYTLGYGEPLHACDTLLCMGSSISQASGIARMTGRRVVAYIGDSTFFHSGLPPLLNAMQSDDNITVVILDNYVTAMTGFQPSLTSQDPDPAGEHHAGARKARRFSIEKTVRGLGVSDVYTVDPFDEQPTLAAFKKAKQGVGVNVVICQAPCIVNERRKHRATRRAPFEVNQDLCNACSLCVRMLGCPAILIVDGDYVIDQDLCDGCEVCAELCNRDAIQQVQAKTPGSDR